MVFLMKITWYWFISARSWIKLITTCCNSTACTNQTALYSPWSYQVWMWIQRAFVACICFWKFSYLFRVKYKSLAGYSSEVTCRTNYPCSDSCRESDWFGVCSRCCRVDFFEVTGMQKFTLAACSRHCLLFVLCFQCAFLNWLRKHDQFHWWFRLKDRSYKQSSACGATVNK